MLKYIAKLKTRPPYNIYAVVWGNNNADARAKLTQIVKIYKPKLPMLSEVKEFENIEIWDEGVNKVYLGLNDFDVYVLNTEKQLHKMLELKQLRGLKSAYTDANRQFKNKNYPMFIWYVSEDKNLNISSITIGNNNNEGIYPLPISEPKKALKIITESVNQVKLEPKPKPKVEPKVEPKVIQKKETKIEEKPKPDLYSRIGLTELALKKLYEALKTKLTEFYRVNCIVDKANEDDLGYFYGVILFDNIVSKSIGVHYGVTDNNVKPWVLLPWVDILNSGTFNVIQQLNVEGATKQDANRWADKHPLVFKDFETVKKEFEEAFEKLPVI